jgi:hypothetical protein
MLFGRRVREAIGRIAIGLSLKYCGDRGNVVTNRRSELRGVDGTTGHCLRKWR